MGDVSAHVVSIPEDELADLLKANIQSSAFLARLMRLEVLLVLMMLNGDYK